MSVHYTASFKINYFTAQNPSNKAKPRDHDPPGYFRSQKYPGYEVGYDLAHVGNFWQWYGKSTYHGTTEY